MSMLRTLLCRAAAPALLTVAVSAQCQTSSGFATVMTPDGSGFAALDEGYSAELPLGFAFTMGGATYTHAIIDSNCELYLTNGSAGAGAGTYVQNVNANIGPSGFGTNSFNGVAQNPRIVVHGGDNHGPNATSDILVDTSVPGAFKVSWRDWSEYGATDSWNCSTTLTSSNDIQFDYATGFNPSDSFGLTAGFGLAGATSVDLSAGGDSGALPLVFETFSGATDLENRSLLFSDLAAGGYSYAVTCNTVPAGNTSFGTGCYDVANPTQAFYQHFPDAATASAALLGTSITLLPTGEGYVVSSGGGTYVAPSPAATVLPLGDDSSVPYTPSTPFPHGGGSVASLEIHSNCFVSMGPGNSNTAWGSVAALLSSSEAAFRANFDLNPAIPGSAVSAEEIGSLLYVTWEAPRWGAPITAMERVQMQFDLTTGSVVYVWETLTSGSSPGDMVVGYAPGPSLDPGAINLATALPIVTSPDVVSAALSLSASPDPVSSPTTGSTITYSIDNIPDANGSSGMYLGVNILSLTGNIPGMDLGFLGMPGCALHVGALDATYAFFGTTPNQTSTFAIPAGVPPGMKFYAQAAALVAPGSLPNGQNAFGAVTSNGIESLVCDSRCPAADPIADLQKAAATLSQLHASLLAIRNLPGAGPFVGDIDQAIAAITNAQTATTQAIAGLVGLSAAELTAVIAAYQASAPAIEAALTNLQQVADDLDDDIAVFPAEVISDTLNTLGGAMDQLGTGVEAAGNDIAAAVPVVGNVVGGSLAVAGGALKVAGTVINFLGSLLPF